MIFLRDNDSQAIRISTNTKTIFEMKFISDEFVCIISTDDKILVTKQLDQSFYDNLSSFMENRYVFNNQINKKTPTKLVWLSDQSGDLSNINETNLMNRLVIEKQDDNFLIYYQNPFFQSMGIKKASHLIAFSPGGNGYWSKNLETGISLQTEIVKMFKNILNNKTISSKRKELK